MSGFPYRLTGPIGTGATLGLVVLRVDETIEHDFRRMLAGREDVALHVSRVASGDELTAGSIAAMEAELPRAAALLPPAAAFDVLAYACTSGTTLIGVERVAALLRQGARATHVTDPLTAALAALAALGAERVALVSPYIEEVAAPIAAAFEAAGHRVTATLSFGEAEEARVARIDPASIADAAREAARAPGTQAVFLSCTNLRTLDIIAPLEAELGLPVLSSNQVLCWHMWRLAGIAPAERGAPGQFAPGRIFARAIAPGAKEPR
ncbi:MAG: Asp/Glu racemase [Alphaproteobacteria bacterium]|nr:MAG: Asp/Glu racemase [Alphaproteobacteria bacterium]